MKQILGALLLGVVGVAILLSLGVWQMRRLAWKESILTAIEAKIAAPPVAIPDHPDPQRDEYLAVTAQGVIGDRELRVLVGLKDLGAGYRIIAPFRTGGRTLLLDRGFVPDASKADLRAGGPLTITGNLHWPDEKDSYTPAPDIPGNIWFARDLPAMAAQLGTEPVLIVARTPTGPGITPVPIGTEGIPNDHLEYAITWFSLAAVWAGMTLLMLWRISRRTN